MYYTSLKQFLISIGITFVSTFALAFLPFLGDSTATGSALFAGAMVAARLATVAVFQAISNIATRLNAPKAKAKKKK